MFGLTTLETLTSCIKWSRRR